MYSPKVYQSELLTVLCTLTKFLVQLAKRTNIQLFDPFGKFGITELIAIAPKQASLSNGCGYILDVLAVVHIQNRNAKEPSNAKFLKEKPMEKLILPDTQVITVWTCEECKENIEVAVTFFQDNGTPVCSGCDRDMIYGHVYLNRDYDGSKCPKCNSEAINGNDIEGDGFDKLYRNCDCDDCNATWTEQAVVLSCDNIE